MPSDLHSNLFRQLREVTSRIKKALGKNELDGLPEMMQAHQEIMLQLHQAGECKEPELLDLLTETNADVQTVIQKIGTMQTEIHTQMKTVANKKKLAGAYGI